MILLAQINTPNPDPNIAWNVILTLGVILALVAQFVMILKSNKAQKREVEFTFVPASKMEFDQFAATTNANFVQVRSEMKSDREANQVHASERSKTLFAQIEKVRTELDGKMEETRLELSNKTDDVHTRINDVLSAVSELRGEIKGMKK